MNSHFGSPAPSKEPQYENGLNSVDYTLKTSRQPQTQDPLWFIPQDLSLPAHMSRGPSHSRRQPNSHIPRARNPFILFRSHFLAQQILPDEAFCRDHRQVSRIVSCVWAALPDSEKDRFYELAEEEKRSHQERFPGYKIVKRASKSRSSNTFADQKQGRMSVEETKCVKIANMIVQGIHGDELTARVAALASEEIITPVVPKPQKSSPSPVRSVSIPTAPVSKTAPRDQTAPARRAKALKVAKSVAQKLYPSKAQVTEKNTLSSIYSRATNPPRKTRAVSYAETQDSDSDMDARERILEDSDGGVYSEEDSLARKQVISKSSSRRGVSHSSPQSMSSRATAPSESVLSPSSTRSSPIIYSRASSVEPGYHPILEWTGEHDLPPYSCFDDDDSGNEMFHSSFSMDYYYDHTTLKSYLPSHQEEFDDVEMGTIHEHQSFEEAGPYGVTMNDPDLVDSYRYPEPVLGDWIDEHYLHPYQPNTVSPADILQRD